MTRKEELKTHLEKLTTLQRNLTKAQQDFTAHGMAFNAWLHSEIGLEKDRTADILIPEILMKWDETRVGATDTCN